MSALEAWPAPGEAATLTQAANHFVTRAGVAGRDAGPIHIALQHLHRCILLAKL